MKGIPESEENSGTILSIDNMIVYNSDIEYLLDELHRIDVMIRFYLNKLRLDQHGYMDDLRGLYISEDEVNTILQTPLCEMRYDPYTHPELEQIETITREINQKKNNNIEKGKELRLNVLSDLFDLLPFEVDVLLTCLAPELDLRYEKLYSYLQNDVTKKWPQVDLVINLLFLSVEERLKGREYFSPDAPLIKNRLIYLTDSGHEDRSYLLSKFIKVDERIIDYLMGSDKIDSRIKNYSSLKEPNKSFEYLILSDDLKKKLIELTIWHSQNDAPIFVFQGPYGTGKRLTAEAICCELGKTLLVVDSRTLMGSESLETLTLIIRECYLHDSILFFESFDVLLKDENSRFTIKNLLETLEQFKKWVFLSGEELRDSFSVIKKHNIYYYTFGLPTFNERKRLWESLLNEKYDLSDDIDINALATKFKLSGGQIRDAIVTACNIAMARKPKEFELTMADLYQGCKSHSNKNLSAFAKKIEPHYTWKDIVLPKDTTEQLKEVFGYIKHKGTVYSDWGFDKKLSMGKGLNALFSGPSGTGKTMAAEIIAYEAKLDLYKIDLSSVVNKYIGETEKNLSKIFKEAETSNAILFFDEADALFGKRSEVKDSHDRYANIEINYLLQRMEEYEGIVILASNYSQNIDEGFQRRMHFRIDFPLPDKKLREKIWRKTFPRETPLNIPRFYMNDIKDAASLGDKLHDAKNPLSAYLREQFASNKQPLIDTFDAKEIQIKMLTKALVDELNRLILENHLFDEQRFAHVQLKDVAQRLTEQKPQGEKLICLNRLLLEEAYPVELAQSYIDFDFLSTIKITGGNIKNIALSAAFLAAGDSSAVRMEHILRATRREFQKMGKLCVAEEFGDYYEMLEAHKI